MKEETDERVLLIEEALIIHCTDRDSTLAHVREYLMRDWPDGKIDMNMAPYHCRIDEYARRLCLVGCQSGDSATMSTRGVA